ncbi:MAG: 4-hydroxybenzoate 3-monooxygenase [Rhodobacteraceae bacterium]|nr:MAG: 4-hydroxybenzoate 3-monooxygenase [Paracoccaceae bacterium]
MAPGARYSDTALARVRTARRVSRWMTNLLHRFPDTSAHDTRLQDIDLACLFFSDAARAALAETDVGLPL